LLSQIKEPEEDVIVDIPQEEGQEADPEELFLDETQKEFENLSHDINRIVENTKSTMTLEKKAKSQTTSSEQKEIMAALDELMSGTMAIAKKVSAALKIYKKKNEEYEKANPHSTLAAWRINKLNTSALRYQKALQAFNAASDSFKAELRKKTARQARMVNQDITDEQIEQIVESNNPTAFMQQALMIPDAMIDRVVDIERRHEGILSIERGVKELQELWNQLAVLVDDQQEQLDQIEKNVEQTLDYVQKGKIALEKANQSQMSARRTMCGFCVCVVIAAVIIGIVMLS